MTLLERDDLVENLAGCVIGSVFLSLLCFPAAGIDFSPLIAMIMENLSVLEQGHHSIWGKFGMERRWFQLLRMVRFHPQFILLWLFQLYLLCLPVEERVPRMDFTIAGEAELGGVTLCCVTISKCNECVTFWYASFLLEIDFRILKPCKSSLLIHELLVFYQDLRPPLLASFRMVMVLRHQGFPHDLPRRREPLKRTH
ncbi:hypothetical protein NE237_010404 [Protea cynaroides]|uniref:Uncharacterized protein n=1 Tax=Protea cynaroides TaxID=273540 RepID=A0A9Q0KZN2_9MAGN|nr:hypothetical protein NE237_010404 [Protea cynaroides]